MIKLDIDNISIKNVMVFSLAEDGYVIEIADPEKMTYTVDFQNDIFVRVCEKDKVVVIGKVKLIDRIKYLFTKDVQHLGSLHVWEEVAE